MKKIIIKILLGLIVAFLLYVAYVLCWLSKIDLKLTPDPEYNTVYSKNYGEDEFLQLKIGETKNEVILKIGEPIKRDTLSYTKKVLYVNSPEHIDFVEGESGLRLLGFYDSLRYSSLSFDEKGAIKDVNIDYKLGNLSSEEIKTLTEEDVFQKFGEPQKQMLCDCKCEIFSYTKLRADSYRGKLPIILLKKILIKDGKVIGKVDQEGSPYNKYIGTCKKISANE